MIRLVFLCFFFSASVASIEIHVERQFNQDFTQMILKIAVSGIEEEATSPTVSIQKGAVRSSSPSYAVHLRSRGDCVEKGKSLRTIDGVDKIQCGHNRTDFALFINFYTVSHDALDTWRVVVHCKNNSFFRILPRFMNFGQINFATAGIPNTQIPQNAFWRPEEIMGIFTACLGVTLSVIFFALFMCRRIKRRNAGNSPQKEIAPQKEID